MKKNLYAIGISVVLAAAMCVGFAACGDDAASAVGEEVSREVWEAAFTEEAFSNVKAESEVESEAEGNTQDGYFKIHESGEMTCVREGDKGYLKIHVKMKAPASVITGGFPVDVDQTAEFYSHGNIVYSQNRNGEWVRSDGLKAAAVDSSESGGWEESGDEYWGESGEGYEVRNPAEFFDSIYLYKSMYDEFTYSAEKKGYVYRGDATRAAGSYEGQAEGSFYAFNLKEYVLKFKDGRLTFMTLDQSGTEQGVASTASVRFSFTYGGQRVTLPKIAE